MINYDRRRFRPVGGRADEESRVAFYHQLGDLLWGEFIGGHARRGVLTGTAAPDGRLEFGYCMVLDTGEVISGHCRSTPEILSDGRIRLHEQWQRFGAQASTGTSAIEEIADLPTASDQTSREQQ
jgi:hypothetical protein